MTPFQWSKFMIRATLAFVLLTFLGTSYANEQAYNSYYFLTPINDLPTGKINLRDSFDLEQVKSFSPNELDCFSSAEEVLFTMYSTEQVNVEFRQGTCYLISGKWKTSDGSIVTNYQDLSITPMWNGQMISRYFDYNQPFNQSDLLGALYSKENWLIVKNHNVDKIASFFPFDLGANDVSSCGDLSRFTLYGIKQSLRFPLELTRKISQLEQLPGCDKYLSLTNDDVAKNLSNEWGNLKATLHGAVAE